MCCGYSKVYLHVAVTVTLLVRNTSLDKASTRVMCLRRNVVKLACDHTTVQSRNTTKTDDIGHKFFKFSAHIDIGGEIVNSTEGSLLSPTD